VVTSRKEIQQGAVSFRRPQQPLRAIIVLAAYLLLTAIMTWPLVTELTTAIPGDGFDGWQNYWNQWWIKVALVDRLQNPFQTDLLYAPTGVGLYFHTLNPFNGVTTLPIQLAFGLLPAYNAVVFLSWTLAGYGLYLLVYWLLGQRRGTSPTHAAADKRNVMAAFIAGVIFTFSPFHMAHLLGHMQVMSLQWIPFYLLYLLRAMQQQRNGDSWWRSALLAGGFLTLTGLCDWYFVLYLFFFTGLLLFWALFTAARAHGIGARWLRLSLPPLLAGLVMLLLLSPLLLPMVREATQFSFMVRPTSDLYTLSATLMDFLVPNRLHSLFRPASFSWPGNQIAPVSERTLAIGYTALILALLALWKQGRSSRFWAASALLFLLLALGPAWHWGTITQEVIPEPGVTPTSWTPFALLNRTIPFMRISRSVSRYALMVQLSMAVLAGLGLAWWLQRRGAMTSGLVSIGILGLILFESWVAPFPMSPPDTPAFYNEIARMDEQGAILNLPMNYDRPGYLLYQTVHQRPLAVAYISRDDPRTLTERVPLLQHFRHLGPDILLGDPVALAPTVLHDLGIGLVIQDRYKMPGGLERSYTEALANAIFANTQAIYTDERLTVHAVQPPPTTEPYLLLGARNWGPLTVTDDGQRWRMPSAEGAALHLLHPTPTTRVEIRYRTLPDVTVTILREGSNEAITTLAAAPTGRTAIVPLDGIEQEEAAGIILLPSAADGVWIEALGLQKNEDG